MIEKTVKKFDLKSDSSINEDLAYWLSKTPQERIAAIELLRRQYHGSSARLQRSARVLQQTHYIGRDDFIKNKRALGRKKDLADLEAVGEK